MKTFAKDQGPDRALFFSSTLVHVGNGHNTLLGGQIASIVSQRHWHPIFTKMQDLKTDQFILN
jgi:hypothetical protein